MEIDPGRRARQAEIFMSSSAPLSALFRSETQSEHAASEKTPLMEAFMRGDFNRNDYWTMLQNLQPVYRSLEEGLQRNAADPGVAPIYFPELARETAIESDLAYFWNGEMRPALTEAAQVYAARIDKIAGDSPYLLAAHTYVRYFGDLSGGQFIARIVRKFLNLSGSDGLAFYDFRNVGADQVELAAFKNRYRAGLDALPVDSAQTQLLVEEAQRAFRFNIAMFEEIQVALHRPV